MFITFLVFLVFKGLYYLLFPLGSESLEFEITDNFIGEMLLEFYA